VRGYLPANDRKVRARVGLATAIKRIVLAFFISIVAVPSYAADVGKIGVVDVHRLVAATGMGESAKASLRKIKKKMGKQPTKANAALEHLLFETLEEIPTFKDGKTVNIESLTEHEPLDFPGYKKAYACHIGHPEPVTLPRSIKANTICNLCYMGKTFTDTVREYRGKIINKEISIQDASIALEGEIRRIMKRAMTGRAPLKEYLGGPPMLTTYATGKKDGTRKKVCLSLQKFPYDEMAGVTGVPLAIATIMLIEGKITKKGILTPEESIDPIEFFNRLALYCDKKNAEDLLIWEIIDI